MTASVLALALLPMAGCARLYKLSPERDAHTDRIFIAGDEWAVVEDSHARVAISGEKVTGSEIYLKLSVTNKSEKRVDVLPDEIRVWAHEDAGKRPLKVWSPDRYMATLRGNQTMSLAILSFANALSSADEGKKTITSTTTGGSQSTTYGSHDTKYTRERYGEKTVTVVDDPAAREAARERDRRQIQELDEQNRSQNQRLEAALLKATTLFKGDRIEGVAIVDAADAALYTVSVVLGENIYRVRFRPKE